MGQSDSTEWKGYEHQLLNDKKQRGILLPHTNDITRSILENYIPIPYLVDIILQYCCDILHTSQILRHPRSEHGFCGFLKDQSQYDLDTVCKLFNRSYQIYTANKYVGYRPWTHPLTLVSQYIHEIMPNASDPIINLCYMYYFTKSEWTQTLSSIDRKLKRLEYQWLTYKEVGDYASLFGKALRYLQIPSKSNIAVCCVNSPQSWICNLGIWSQAYTSVPIPNTVNKSTNLEILNSLSIPLIVIEKGMLYRLFNVLDETENTTTYNSLKYIVQIDVQECFSNLHEYISDEDVRLAANHSIQLIGLSEMFQLSLEEELLNVEPLTLQSPVKEDIAYIIHQDKKFINLSHGAIAATVASLTRSCVQLTSKDTHYSYIPFDFPFEMCYEVFVTAHGAKIAYFQGSIKWISEDCRAIRPTLFIGPPRVFEKVYTKYQQRTYQFGFAKKWFVSTAEDISLKELRKGERSNFYDQCIWKSISEQMGFNEVRSIICIQPQFQPQLKQHIAEFMRLLIPNVILQHIYGVTELCNLVTITDVDDWCLGHVGVPVDNMEIRLIDVPEQGHFTQKQYLSSGEIQVRTCYMNQADKCWISTCVIAKINPNGTLSIVDTKRSYIKTSMGERISLSKVEDTYLKCSSLIAQMYVYGNSLKSFIVAVVVPNALELVPKLKQCGLWTDKEDKLQICSTEYLQRFKEICQQNRKMVNEIILEDMSVCERQCDLIRFKTFEYVKDIYCEFEIDELLQGFNVANGTLEATFQKKRSELFLRYRDKLKAMYIAHGEPPDYNNHHWL